MTRVLGAAAAAADITRRATGRGAPRRTSRWLGVTIFGTPDEIAPDGELPEPLQQLGDRIEVRMQPAPGSRGTELYARPVAAPPSPGLVAQLLGRDALAPIRVALREAKALAENW